jgi:hypothetical protein
VYAPKRTVKHGLDCSETTDEQGAEVGGDINVGSRHEGAWRERQEVEGVATTIRTE